MASSICEAADEVKGGLHEFASILFFEFMPVFTNAACKISGLVQLWEEGSTDPS